MLDAQRNDKLAAELDELRSQLSQLRTENALLQRRLDDQESWFHGMGSPTTEPQSPIITSVGRSPSRRTVLKAGAAGLAAMYAAGLAGSLRPALASDPDHPDASTPTIPSGVLRPDEPTSTGLTGSALLMGVSSQSPTNPTDQTRMYNPSTTSLMPNTLRMDNYTSLSLSLPASTRIAVAGTTSGTDAVSSTRVGVYGAANTNGYGVWGHHDGSGVGVFASVGGNGTACRAEATGTAEAFFGTSVDDNAAELYSTNEYGAFLSGGRAPVRLAPVAGIPFGVAHSIGELLVDSYGNFWMCTATGTPGTWRKIAGAAPGYDARGGTINLLSTPIRIFDTRPGQPAPINPGAPLGAGTTYYLQVTGIAVGGVAVPVGAKAVTGNITVTGSVASGWLTLFPADVPVPLASTINYVTGQTLANGVTVGLNATGAMKIYAGSTTNALFDATGFVM
jgi:hypothetical protein